MKKTYRMFDVLNAIWSGIKWLFNKIKDGIEWYIINICVIHPLIFVPGATFAASIEVFQEEMTKVEAIDFFLMMWVINWVFYLGWLFRKHLIKKKKERDPEFARACLW